MAQLGWDRPGGIQLLSSVITDAPSIDSRGRGNGKGREEALLHSVEGDPKSRCRDSKKEIQSGEPVAAGAPRWKEPGKLQELDQEARRPELPEPWARGMGPLWISAENL